ncbi:hypothetical protein ABKV19_022417 [Rosa sericea]
MPAACRCSVRFSSLRRNPTPFGTSSFRLRHRRSCPDWESGLLAASSKKELYLALCNKPLLIDDGKLSRTSWTWQRVQLYQALRDIMFQLSFVEVTWSLCLV